MHLPTIYYVEIYKHAICLQSEASIPLSSYNKTLRNRTNQISFIVCLLTTTMH